MPRPLHHSHASPPLQLPALTTDAWTSEIVPRLPPDFAAQAVSLKAFHRSRHLTQPSDLLRAILAYALCLSSFRSLGAWATLIGLASLSDTAWRKRLRQANAWLLWLLSELLACPAALPHPLPGTGRVLLVDATRLRQAGGCGDDWRLHTAYDLRPGRLAQVHLTGRSGGETLARFSLQPGDIVVCDSGYGHRASLASVVAQQADLVVRICPSQFPLCQADGTRLDPMVWLRQRGAAVRSFAVWCESAQHRYAVRLVVVKLPASVARANRRRLLQRWKQKGHKLNPTTVFLAGFVLMVTTLAQAVWSDDAVARLYRARWQIELVFKRMKDGLGVGQLRSTTRESVEATVRALMVGWAFQEGEAQRLRAALVEVGRDVGEAGGWERVMVSSWGVSKLCLETLRQQVRGEWTAEQIRACLPLLRRYLCRPMRRRGHQETMTRDWLEERMGHSPAPQRLAA